MRSKISAVKDQYFLFSVKSYMRWFKASIYL